MRLSVSLALAAATGAVLAGQVAAQNPTCWNPNIGTNLALTDDSLAVGLPLNFAFDMPGGGQTSSIDVCSNGFVWLVSGSTTSTDFTPSVAEVLSNPARICASWMDLNPGAGGTVNFDSQANYAVVTWLDVPEYGNAGVTNTIQLTLYNGGAFQITVRRHTVTGTRDLIVGCSPGGGAADPGEIDYSTIPFASSGVPTIYENFTLATDPRDLDGKSMIFQPDGAGGYVVLPVGPCASVAAYGAGCPTPPQFYEVFTAGMDLQGTSYRCSQSNGAWTVTPCAACFEPNYQGNLGLTDDSLAVGLSLGFNFPLPGTGGATTSAIDVCSNGFVWMVSGASTSSDFSESIAELLSNPTRLAACWDDLNPGAAGAVHGVALPGKYVVTWENVPQFGNTDSNTFQAQFFANGDIILYYDANMQIGDSVVGYSFGGGAADDGRRDISSAPFSTGNSAGGPVSHTTGGGGAMNLGGTVSLDANNLPGTTIAAVVNIGFNQLNLDLSLINMPGCFLLASGEISAPLAIAGSTGSLVIGVPNNASLAGGHVYTQAIVLSPGSNPLGAVTSNALNHTIGY